MELVPEEELETSMEGGGANSFADRRARKVVFTFLNDGNNKHKFQYCDIAFLRLMACLLVLLTN